MNTTNKPPVGVLERAVHVLECFNDKKLSLSLSSLSQETGLDKATLLRLLSVLIEARIMLRNEEGEYTLGPSLLHLGRLYYETYDISDRIKPALRSIAQSTGETVALYVRSDNYRICLFRYNSAHEIRHHVEVGQRIALVDGGASAHVLKAISNESPKALNALRTEGYVMTREERVPDMASVGLPLFEYDGKFIGAIVVLGLATRHDIAAQKRAASIVKTAVKKQGFLVEPPRGWASVCSKAVAGPEE